MFSVQLSNSARKGLERCPKEYTQRIKEALLILRYDFSPFRLFDVRKIKGRRNVFRIRIGKWRIQYEVFKEQKLILVFSIDLRDEISYK